ncbi:TIGR02281 family clan AA aspartic protease [Sphingobium sp. SA916]|uniref:retropepsin-like aspartic protease family protein n=1 Tax=Sphingobium sp. SA916 TaxID=1851207 RepID=UPI00209C1F91|nr:TIGR02281 family clan AA aspartic protease [Sphingobium sp. SA916]
MPQTAGGKRLRAPGSNGVSIGSKAMDIATNPEWQRLLPYALAGAVFLILLFNIPFIGRVLRALLSVALLALCLLILAQQAPFDPNLNPLMNRLGLSSQQVTGDMIRIRMAADGHFWARAELNGVKRRMLIDSGATVTALSQETARQAAVSVDDGLVPVLMRTANGTIRADTGTVARLKVSGMEARNLKVIISPALGNVDILGMNFLTQLASWRVEGRELILVPAKDRDG